MLPVMPEIKERMELDVYVQKLSVLRTAYHNDQYKLEDDVNVNLPHSIVKKENMIAALKRDQATLDANHAQNRGRNLPYRTERKNLHS